MHRHMTRGSFLVLFLIISLMWPIHSEISNCVIKREEERCMERINLHNPKDDEKFECPWEWDNLTCWQAASVGEVVEVTCPELFEFMSPEDGLGKISRNCTEFGWSEPYPHYMDACMIVENTTKPDMYYASVKALYTVGYSTSLVSLIAAMVILCRFRKLHCTRNFIHMNLFVSFILRAISVFIKDGVLYAEEDSDHCFVHTHYNPCLYDNQYKQNTKYWCEGYFWNYCKITASTNAIGKWTITDYPADSIFTVKLNNLKSSDSGYYWCAIIGNHAEPDDRKYLYVTVKKAPDVFVVNSSVSGHEGGDISVQCFYSSGYKNEVKQWCRYKDQSCYTVGRTNTSQNSSVQISDDGRKSFTVLMTGLRLTDSGWYYCSAGDLQAPVQLLVQRDNESKSMSESDDAGQFPSTCKNQTASKDS
ncbi:uncharacterized protein LOC113040159 [Carassius auratus]|uniref:Uncharacterized protein LOC113040159 n=1 Tax=Carassius auratus TaxID=7957 RepID=A0A6P6J2F1_CARAU|nr:uncharacterized protein LOC113040159 [Carassius auratus]